jgi:hypothetical protein
MLTKYRTGNFTRMQDSIMRRFGFIGLFVAVFIAFVVLLLLTQSRRITRATLEKIRVGMNKAEVDDLLGGQGMTFRFGEPGSFWTYYPDDVGIMPGNSIHVCFDEEGKVVAKDFTAWERNLWIKVYWGFRKTH